MNVVRYRTILKSYVNDKVIRFNHNTATYELCRFVSRVVDIAYETVTAEVWLKVNLKESK